MARDCKSCAYFVWNLDREDDAKELERVGHCRRHPRQLVHVREGTMDAIFPAVQVGDWCGEWEE